MPIASRTSVIGVIYPDERVRGTLEVLLTLEFGFPVRTAPDFPALMTTLSPHEDLILIVAEPNTGGASVPVVPIPPLPIDATAFVETVRAAIA